MTMKNQRQEAQQQAEPRTRGAGRQKRLFVTINLEKKIGEGHLIRGLKKVVGELDWSNYLSRVRARGSHPGRPALHPKVLATLWLYAMSQGVTSARELERLCSEDLPYMWALEGESINHHTLSDFLRQESGLLEDLLSQTIWELREAGEVSFDTLLVDGTKVDARASAHSFRGEEELRQQLSSHLSRLRTGEASRSEESAKARAAHRRAEREAVARHEAAAEKLRARKEKLCADGRAARKAKAESLKVSTTDADARFMRRADGGSRVSVNIQVGCCAQSGAVLSVDATDQANDAGFVLAAALKMKQSCGVLPRQAVADGGCGGKRSAEGLRDLGVDLVAPLRRTAKAVARGPADLRLGGDAEDWQWGLWEKHGAWARLIRMRVERMIGSMKRRGLWRVPVFGLTGARRWALWHALTHNILLGLGIRG